MKPFNLEEAKKGKPVTTKDGNPVRILCFDRDNFTDTPILALVNIEGVEMARYYHDDGSHNDQPSLDLVMAGEKKEGWIRLYKGNMKTFVENTIYKTKDEALNTTDPDLIDVIKIEWEE
jgi:hypothetical protein